MGFVRKETAFDILRLPRTASSQDVDQAYFQMTRFWEDLRNNLPSPVVEEKLLELTRAYQEISTEESRKRYAETLDFNFVMIDGKTKDPEMEGAYQEYLERRSKEYKEVLQEFSLFKAELGRSLWVLKTTTAYLLVSLLAYSLFYFSFAYWFPELSSTQKEKISQFSLPLFLVLVLSGFGLFRRYYQVPRLRTWKSESRNS